MLVVFSFVVLIPVFLLQLFDERQTGSLSPPTPSNSSVQKQAVIAATSPSKSSTTSSSSWSSSRREVSVEKGSTAGQIWLSVITACTHPILDNKDDYSDHLPRKPFFQIAEFVSEVSTFAKNLTTDPDYQLANVI